MLRLVACAMLLGACASAPAPARLSTGPLQAAGSRCQGDKCSCRAVDDYNRGGLSDESGVPEGMKRFEIRTGRGLDAEEITVEGRGTLTKSTALPEPACGYIDLAPGKYRVHVHARASSESGMVPALWVNEWSARTHDWYDSFFFRCGGNEPCTKDMMTLWNDSDGKKPRGVWDPCGSTRIRNIHWEVQHSPDVKVQELELDFVLDVYKFTPRFPHGAKSCHGVGGVEVEDQPKDLPQ